MAFNGYKLNYPTNRITVSNQENEVGSVLSDDQSSWVLFDPDSDILSSTTQDREGSFSDPDVDLELYDETPHQSVQQQGLQQGVQDAQPEQDEQEEGEDTDTDSLIDDLDPSQLRVERLFDKKYDSINTWKLNNDSIVDDNVASWDLDENLSNNTLDTSILKLTEFYGDELIKTLNKRDIQKFKRIHRDLRTYLTRKPNPLLDQLLLKLYPHNNPITESLPKSGYNRYLESTISSHYHHDDLTSETASSSLILCGGDSWNDV